MGSRSKISMIRIFTIQFSLLSLLVAQPGTLSSNIHIDQFGYSVEGTKIAIISNPKVGYNAGQTFAPGSTYQVHKYNSNELVFSSGISSWNDGTIHTSSGDQVWWLDFSDLSTPGQYYIYDSQNDVHSHAFELSDSIYRHVLKAAVRTFYYQRCGTYKGQTFVGPNWTDGFCHFGGGQDRDCRLVTDQSSATSKNLSGGWHDAGDYNKYMNYADGTVHDLLFAYEERPEIWGDDYNLPESGNNIPDVLDEIKWELDWMLKMQTGDGSVLHKVAVTEWQSASPPSADSAPRFYAPPTASATISACGVFAHAAIVFGSIQNSGMSEYADTLQNRANRAWEWLENNPDKIPSNYDNAGFAQNAVEDDPYQQSANRVCAAAYLFVLTGNDEYRSYFDNHYQEIHLMQWQYIYSSESDYQNGLLYYLNSQLATPTVVSDIKSAYLNGLNTLYQEYLNHTDAYQAYIDAYYWGSNKSKSDNGSAFMNMQVYDLNPQFHPAYRSAARGYLNYLHGTNPNNLVYLTNMSEFGAEESVNEIYHGWFKDGSDWDNAQTSLFGPPPGFVPGGPNPGYTPDDAYTGPDIVPPQNQPDQKAWKDWNTGWPENSWEVTENHIPNQAAYIKLLSKLTGGSKTALPSERKSVSPEGFKLGQNYPNPFNGQTVIPYYLDSQELVSLTIYNSLGQEVALVLDQKLQKGQESAVFYGNSLSAGIYFYVLKVSGRKLIKKMIYLP